MNDSTHVLVAGGGIGGLTLAVALRRAGLKVTVFERAAEWKPLGAGITVQMNAMTALRELGLDAAVAAVGERVLTSAVLDASGRVLSGMPFAQLEAEVGVPSICIHRSRLHGVLLEALGQGVVRLGAAVTRFEERGEKVMAALADGTSVEGDLLVGADGLRSAVRAQLLGDASLRYSGYTSWRGICRNEGLVPDGQVTESWGAGARFGIVPIGHGEVYWFCTANAPAGEADPQGGPHAKLTSLFGRWHAPIPELLRRSAPESILRTDIHDRPPVKAWTRGRVTLLGDAAHPMTPNMGQGGCQAIEDAVVLGKSLGKAGSLAAALATYERTRIPRANGIVETSWSFGRMGQLENRAAVFLRDAAMRLLPSSVQAKQLKKVMRFETGV